MSGLSTILYTFLNFQNLLGPPQNLSAKKFIKFFVTTNILFYTMGPKARATQARPSRSKGRAGRVDPSRPPDNPTVGS